MNRENIVQQLKDQAQHLIDRPVITRGQRLVVAGLMRDAAESIERLDGVKCAEGEGRLIAVAKAYREMNAYYRIQSRPPERLFKALKEAEATLKELDT